MGKSNCEFCVNYVYNEDEDLYECFVNLDEDELYRFMSSAYKDCPYFHLDDEYSIAKKQ